MTFIRLVFIGLICFSSYCQAHNYCYFIPPQDWQCADPKNLSSHVQVGFFGKGQTNFHPSLNLAIEEIDNVTMKEYLKAVKNLHESDHKTTWRDLGKFQTKAGPANLTEITTKNNWGEIRMLQLILIAEKKAYIITGAMLKEEFAEFRDPIVKAFRTLTLTENLLEGVNDSEKKVKLQDAMQNMPFDNFQKLVLKETKEMGLHWQILLLKDAFEKIKKDQKKP